MPAANRTTSFRRSERASRRHLGGKPGLIGAIARRSAWIVPIVWWFVVCCPGFAQELVNPDFDTDLTGWGVFPPPSHSWSPVDHEDDPASGSLLAVKEILGGGLLQASQCLEINPLEGNSLTAMVLVPASSDPADFYLGFSYYSDPACHAYLDFDRIFDAPPLGEWTHFTFGPSFAPAGALSVEVNVSLFEAFGSTVPVTAHIDAVRIFIFADGFESSDTSAWGATAP